MEISKTSPNPEELRRAGEQLVAWYREHLTPWPWRESADPWSVLVSEIMLQQTQAKTVAGRFADFMKRFPDPAALAGASEDELMKAWEGLGYYRRGRNLRLAAKLLVQDYDGSVPRNRNDLLKLPGIGPYTAGAVQSIAFRQSAAAIDGNAERFLARLLAYTGNVRGVDGRHMLESVWQTMQPEEAPDDFTQAVMELGQTICGPRTTRCAVCPLRETCRGREEPQRFPVRAPKQPKREETWTVVVLATRDVIALRRRPPEGLLAGLYEPLNWAGRFGVAQAVQNVQAFGASVKQTYSLAPWHHEFTHRRWLLTGWLFEVDEQLTIPDVLWADREMLRHKVAVPTAFKPALYEWESMPWKI